MLKYQINTSKLYSDITLLPIQDYKMYEFHLDDEKMNVELYYNTQIDIKVNDTINVSIEITPEDYYENPEYYRKDFKVTDVDLTRNIIVLTTPRYINLQIISIEEKYNEDKYWWYFNFKENHHFYNMSSKNNNLYFEYYKNGLYRQHSIKNCEIIDETTLRYCYDKNNESDNEVGKIIFNKNDDDYPRGSAELGTVRFVKREHFLITNKKNTKFYIKKYNLGVSIPMLNTHDISITRQYDINEKFVEVEKAKFINKPIEMEKNMFIPICKYWSDPIKRSIEKTDKVNRINFNLHLRQRHGKDWQVDGDDYWNGVIKKDETLLLDSNYFASQYKNNTSMQSDLLSKLGFNDADVKYQKSRLKKSFLRLSFYDSPNPGSQNLLAYSTIFLDTNKLSGNFIRNAHQEKYKLLDQINEKLYTNLSGIRVNREIDFYEANDITVNFDNCENYRLSSQFTVSDKNCTQNSSEGFYLYLWKDLTQGIVPIDLYLKIDFNHAGYGRTIPLMFPYFAEKTDDGWDGQTSNSWVVSREPVQEDNLKEGENEEGGQTFGIKSFSDIVNDWNYDGYNIQKFLKYSYIHLKCQYDDELKQYVYYLDNLFYENCHRIFDSTTNTLNINLYEGKVVDTSVDTPNVGKSKYGVRLLTNEIDGKNETYFKLIINDTNQEEDILTIDLNTTVTDIYNCDENGFVYDGNKVSDINDIQHDENNEYYYKNNNDNTNIPCDKNGYILDIDEETNKPYKILDANGDTRKYSPVNGQDYYVYDDDGPYCSFNGYVLEKDDSTNEPHKDDAIIYKGKNNVYTVKGKNVECDINGNIYQTKEVGDTTFSKYVMMTENEEEPLHVYWDEKNNVYYCKREYVNVEMKGSSEKYEINYDKIFMNNKKISYIKFNITYKLNAENGLWDNYITTINNDYNDYNDIIKDIKYGLNDGDCLLQINYIDNLKKNIKSFIINNVTNEKYSIFLDYENKLHIVDFIIDVECVSDEKYFITSAPLQVKKSITDKELKENELKFNFQQQEFFYRNQPRFTELKFNIIDSNGLYYTQSENDMYVFKFSGIENEELNKEFYLDNIIDNTEVDSISNDLKYHNKLTIFWKNLDYKNWLHWKFANVNVKLIRDENTIAEGILRFTFLEYNHKNDKSYIINEIGFCDGEKFLSQNFDFYTDKDYDYRFNAYIVPLYTMDIINYNCIQSYPLPIDFEEKFIGVESNGNTVFEKDEGTSISYFKIPFKPYNKNISELQLTNAVQKITLWVKSQKFTTLTQTINQNIK